MSRTPIENHADLRIGMVDFISPTEIKVRLDAEAPDGIAANAGLPRAFPRINSYVLIPLEGCSIVCQIEWIAIDHLGYQKSSKNEHGVIDLPLPVRNMLVVPLGILCFTYDQKYKFHRGVSSFPSIGSPVLIPTDNQLIAIVESGSNRRVLIGTSPLTANAEVKIDPDRLFGRHLAVLGNTGSGKSCTVAGLIHWTLEATQKNMDSNARFIILDPNGEYSKSFREKATVFKVGDENNPLEVPLWLWSAKEWSTFSKAAAGIQEPLLRRALRAMRNEEVKFVSDQSTKLKRLIRIILFLMKTIANKGDYFNTNSFFTDKLEAWSLSLQYYSINDNQEVHGLVENINTLVREHKIKKNANFTQYIPYTENEIEILINTTKTLLYSLGGSEKDFLPKSENTPIFFDSGDLVNYIEALAQDSGNEQYMDSLITRIRSLQADPKMNQIIGTDTEKKLEKWLEKYLGNGTKTQVSIVDLSLVPSEIIHIVSAVISRIIFESLQRYRKAYQKSLPTVLVLEEAHTFVTRYNENSDASTNAEVCTKIFEKISREGRKYGLGLVISSQRPSELSPTVLSQCNSFILHRISNDRDQDLVGRLLPDSFKGLLKELPSLPSQKAILLGWASELPLMFNVRTLKESQKPQSDDPDYWDVWTGKEAREVDWGIIVKDWQERSED